MYQKSDHQYERYYYWYYCTNKSAKEYGSFLFSHDFDSFQNALQLGHELSHMKSYAHLKGAPSFL